MVASVDAQAKVKGERMGEATMLVRYQGKFQAIPVTVLETLSRGSRGSRFRSTTLLIA